MLPSLSISKTGLDAQQTQLNVISNNLANVSTTGFKQSRAEFQDMLYQTLKDPGAASSQQTQAPSGLQIGTGVKPIATTRIHTQATCSRRTIRSTWRSRVRASSRCKCPTAPPRTPVTARFRPMPKARS